MMNDRLLWIGLGILTLARLIIGAANELSPDEAYYYLWTERMDWSYYSKGPGVAMAIKFATTLFGKTALGLRFLSPLLGLGSSIILFQLARRLFDRDIAIWTVVMLNLTPIFNVGSIVMTIDPLMIFFWTGAMLTTWNAIQNQAHSLKWWLLTGILIGLGLLCKYTILIQLISLVLFLALSPERRVQFRRPGFYLALLVTALFTLPILIWNSQNGWITFVHLGDHTKSEQLTIGSALSQFGEFFGQHFGVYSPLIFAGLVWTTVLAIKRFKRSLAETFLGCYALPIILMYFLLSFKAGGELNWTAPGFVSLGPLLIYYWREMAKDSQKWKRPLATAALAFSAALTLWTANPDVLRTTGLSWPYERDIYWRLRGWESVAEQLSDRTKTFETETGEKPFLIANRYQTAAAPAFYFPDESSVFRPSKAHPLIHMMEPPLPEDPEARKEDVEKIRNQFSFWPRYHRPRSADENPFIGRNALYLTDQVDRQSAPSEIRDAFTKVEPIAWIEIVRRGRPLRGWKVFACYDYKTLNPE